MNENEKNKLPPPPSGEECGEFPPLPDIDHLEDIARHLAEVNGEDWEDEYARLLDGGNW